MQYMRLSEPMRAGLLASLDGMAEYLAEAFRGLSPEQARIPGPDGTFSPVEQVWHLADLERDGFNVRIKRLLCELQPHLPNFDGTAVAAARNYRALSLTEGLAAFAEARQENLALLRRLDAREWLRGGTQEGVGAVSLCDMPSFLQQHDEAHRTEIEAWKEHVSGSNEGPRQNPTGK